MYFNCGGGGGGGHTLNGVLFFQFELTVTFLTTLLS